MADSINRSAIVSPNNDIILDALRTALRTHQQLQTNDVIDIPHHNLLRAIQEMELYRVVSAHWPLTSTTFTTRIVNIIRKLTRRLLRWYINPIVEQQNAYNDIMANMLRQLVDAFMDLRAQLDTLQQADSWVRESAQLRSTALLDQSIVTGDTVSPALQAIVKERALSEPPATFPDLAIQMDAPQLRLHQEVTAHWPLVGATIPGRIAALTHKAVRRYLRWYINPIVEQQNAANAAFTDAILACMRLDAERRAQIAARRAIQASGQSASFDPTNS